MTPYPFINLFYEFIAVIKMASFVRPIVDVTRLMCYVSVMTLHVLFSKKQAFKKSDAQVRQKLRNI